jgi:hypothetical protein
MAFHILGKRKWDLFLQTVFAVGLICALIMVVNRYKAESVNRTVEIIISDWSIEKLAEITQTKADEILNRMGKAGATTLAVDELSILQAAQAGYLSIIRPLELGHVRMSSGALDYLIQNCGLFPVTSRDAVTSGPIYLTWDEDSLPGWFKAALDSSIESLAEPVCFYDHQAIYRLVTPDKNLATTEDLLTQGLGYPIDKINSAQEKGFNIAYRPIGLLRLSPDHIGSLLPKEDRSGLIVFSGKQVPGYPDLINIWKEELSGEGYKLAWTEFSSQAGVKELFSDRVNLIRLHSISEEELLKMDVPTATTRLVRAVKERGVRVVYLNLFLATESMDSDTDLLSYNYDYVADVADGIRKAGYQLGQALVLPPLTQTAFILLMMFLTVMVSVIWLGRVFVRMDMWAEVALFVPWAVISCLQAMNRDTVFLQLCGLITAIALPSLAVLKVLTYKRSFADFRNILKSFLIATIISLSGALLVVGLLAQNRFQIGISQFLGVKAMHILPPIIVFLGLIWEKPVKFSDLWTKVAGILQEEVRLKWVMLAAIFGVLGGFMVLRTGNNQLAVWNMELKIREFLETVLSVRPRTKEFLIGHPVMWLALSKVGGSDKYLRAILGAVGVIGQLSLVNTFAHIHSPLSLCFGRTILGMVLGILLGLVLWLVFCRSGIKRGSQV